MRLEQILIRLLELEGRQFVTALLEPGDDLPYEPISLREIRP